MWFGWWEKQECMGVGSVSVCSEGDEVVEKISKPKRIRLGIENGDVVPEEKAEPKNFIAKKDFVIHHNDYKKVILKGDDLSDVPEVYHENLRTEGVL